MDFNNQLNKMSRGVLHFLFPNKCPFCGTMLGKNELMCPECEKNLPRCHEIRTGADFGRCAAVFYYEDKVRQAILRYKFHGKMGGLNCFGQLMAEQAAEKYSGEFDAITWVPVSKKRLKKRGFDQARFLAASLCVDWHVPPQETLEKTVDNPAQSGLGDKAARRANVLGVYRTVRPEEIVGKRFLLVDDILTTGATMGEAARVLKEAGAADVMGLTLAMTRN